MYILLPKSVPIPREERVVATFFVRTEPRRQRAFPWCRFAKGCVAEILKIEGMCMGFLGDGGVWGYFFSSCMMIFVDSCGFLESRVSDGDDDVLYLMSVGVTRNIEVIHKMKSHVAVEPCVTRYPWVWL